MDFIYKLSPVSLQALDQADKRTKEILEAHADYIDKLVAEKVIRLVGRTEGKEFGMVVFTAEGEPEAFEIMNQDPAIKNKIMKGELYPFLLVHP